MGFTVVELLAVILIIGILLTVGSVAIAGVNVSAQDQERKSKATVIAEALEKYYQENGIYPTCSELTKPAKDVTNETLTNITTDILKAPGANSDENSINCTNLTSKTFLYESTTGRQYTLSYIKESSKEAIKINSRYSPGVLANTSLSIDNVFSNQINLHWDIIEGASDYKIQKSTASDFSANITELNTKNNSINIDSLNAGMLYYFRVLGKSLNDASGWSNTKSATTTINTPTMSTVSANSNSTTTTYSWPVVSCESGTSIRYQYRYTISNGYDSGYIPTSNNSVNFTTINEGYTYTVAVQAQCYKDSISSNWSSSKQASYTRPITTKTLTLSYTGGGDYINCAPENGTCSFTGTRTVRYGADTTKFEKCADENGTCSFTGTRTVRYGADTRWVYKYNVVGSITCNNTAFGSDPADGTVKACYYETPASLWLYKTNVTGSIACTNTVFGGDPAEYTVKACYYQDSVSVSGGGTYNTGSTQTITASPSKNFVSWSGDSGCSGLASHSITMTTNKNCQATFAPVDVSAPAIPTVTASISGLNATGTSSNVICSKGVAEYQLRYNSTNTYTDGTWSNWTAWSTSTKSMTVGTMQGRKYTFQSAVRCNDNGAYSAIATSIGSSVVKSIDTPPAPTYTGPTVVSSYVYFTASFSNSCPSGTDIVNGTYRTIAEDTHFGPHPFGFSDWWYTSAPPMTVQQWGKYQCQTVYTASGLSPESYNVIYVY